MKVFLCVFFCLFLSSCNPSHAPKKFTGNAMTIPYCVQIGDPLGRAQTCEIEEIILNTFSEVHRIYNNWNPESEISLLNHLPAYQKAKLSSELHTFLSYIDSIVTITEGKFDPTVAPLHLLWKKCLTNGTLPTQQMQEDISTTIGWEKIHIEEGFFWKEHPFTSLDLCGISKGYAVDLLTERLIAAGFSQIYVEWGGEIRTHGLHPECRPWKIGIAGTESVDLIEAAIATSGSYIQNWHIEDCYYTHIIDPILKRPLYNAPISSASVIAPTCAQADALATSLMLFPSKDAAYAWAKEKGFEIRLW